MRSFLFIPAVLYHFCFPAAVYGQATADPIAYTNAGSIYTQNFDGLAASGTFSLNGKGPFNLSGSPLFATNLRGWQCMMLTGSGTNGGFAVSTGSSTGSATYSFGSSGSANRSLGTLASGTGVYAFGLILNNQTGAALNNFTISFTAKQWRRGGSGNRNVWTFSYKTGIINNIDQASATSDTALNFGSVTILPVTAALNGNLTENQQLITATVTGMNWKNGEQLLLRWDDADETGSDDGVAMDNFSFSAARVSAVPSVSGVRSSDITDSSAIINGFINDNNSFTRFVVEYDTSLSFISPVTIVPKPDNIPDGTGNTPFTTMLSGLQAKQIYYYRIRASNNIGMSTTDLQNFMTTARKVFPQIINVAIPNRPMKINDVVPVTIMVKPDTAAYKLVGGSINNLPLTGFIKINDSNYNASFTIVSGGIDILASANIPVSIQLKNAAGNSAVYTAEISQTEDAIDANKPAIVSVLLPANKLYKANDTLSFIAVFNEKIIVDTSAGLPVIQATIGSRIRNFSYCNGSGTAAILFRYIITSGESDDDGIKLNAPVLLNGGSINDFAGNPAMLAVVNAGVLSGITVDAVVPAIVNVAVPVSGIYKKGNTLDFVIDFSEPVTVTGIPSLAVTIGSSSQYAVFIAGSGSASLTFRYTIGMNDLDKKGISIGKTIMLNGAAISDLAGNDASLSLKNIGALGNVKVDAVAPVFANDSMVNLSSCQNTNKTSINDLLKVIDKENSEILSWDIVTNPVHGSLKGFPLDRPSNGDTTSPAGLTYTPLPDFHGSDRFTVSISDGCNTCSITINVVINKLIDNNIIFPPQLICAGSTPKDISGTAPNGGDGSYRYAWEVSTSSDSTGFTTISNTNNTANYSPRLSVSSWYKRTISSGDCSNTSLPILIKVVKEGLWTGSFNNNWNQAGNWCGGIIPSIITDVIIPDAGSRVIYITDSAACNSIALWGNSTLKLTGTLQIKNKLSTEDTVDLTNGTLIYNGSMPQFIKSNYWKRNETKNLIIDNTTSVSLTEPLHITGVLTINNGTLNTNDVLNIRNTGCIGPLAMGSKLAGQVNIEHHIHGKSPVHLITHPFSKGTGLNTLTQSIPITGFNGATNGFSAAETNQPSAFWHDDQIEKKFDIEDSWIPFTNTDGTGINEWKRYQGIKLLLNGKAEPVMDMPGNGDSTPHPSFPIKLVMSGQVNQGDQEMIFQKKEHDTYHLTGNPYLCNINTALITYNSGIGNYYWIWDARQGIDGGYTSIPFLSTNIIGPLHAFFVKTNSNTDGSLLFTENCKITDTTRLLQTDDRYQIELRLESDSIFWDRILIYPVDSASERLDKLDAEKMKNNDVNFYSLSRDQWKLSADARVIRFNSLIPLGISTSKPRTFRIRVSMMAIPQQLTLQLHDKYLNKWMRLSKDSSYQFVTSSDTSSYGDHRFEIVASSPKTNVIVPDTRLKVAVNPVPATDKIDIQFNAGEAGPTIIRLLSIDGRIVKTQQIGIKKEGLISLSVNDVAKGIYFLEVKCGLQGAFRKIIKL